MSISSRFANTRLLADATTAWHAFWSSWRVVSAGLVVWPLPSCAATRAPWRTAYAAITLSVTRRPMLSILNSVGSSTSGIPIASSMADCPASGRRARSSVRLRLEANMVGLCQLERADPQEGAAPELEVVVNGQPEEVALAVDDVAPRGRPRYGGVEGGAGRAVVVRGRKRAARSEGSRRPRLGFALDVDLCDLAEVRVPRRSV